MIGITEKKIQYILVCQQIALMAGYIFQTGEDEVSKITKFKGGKMRKMVATTRKGASDPEKKVFKVNLM